MIPFLIIEAVLFVIGATSLYVLYKQTVRNQKQSRIELDQLIEKLKLLEQPTQER